MRVLYDVECEVVSRNIDIVRNTAVDEIYGVIMAPCDARSAVVCVRYGITGQRNIGSNQCYLSISWFYLKTCD